MVVCPCGVMVPAAGVGRVRRGTRGPTGCFDSPSTVTTQPKDPEDTPASVEKLAAAAAATTEPSSIPRPLSRGGKNKGPGKGSDDIKGDHASRTTLALATTESGRYVGTRPLRSNRSPTPTLHKLPQKTTTTTSTSRDNLAVGVGGGGGGGGGGRPTKHLPAVRTSPTSPLDNHDTTGVATRGPCGYKGPAALPRQNGLNAVNLRMNDINSNNQRRLLMQTNATQLRNPADNPTTKTYYYHRDNDDCNPATTNVRMRIYENLLHERIGRQEGASSLERTDGRSGDEFDIPQFYENVSRMEGDERISPRIYENLLFEKKEGYEEEEVIYENVAHLRTSIADAILPGLPSGGSFCDVTGEKQMKSSSDSVTPEGSLVWLSDSWKYNTIKKAPEFNIFEFPEIDSLSERSDDEENIRKNAENEERRKAVGEGDDKSTRKKITNGNEKGDSARKMEMTMEKGKKKIRSKLPLFRWKSDRQGNEKGTDRDKDENNKGGDTMAKVETVIKPTLTTDGVLKTDNKRERNASGVPDSHVSIHKRKIQKYSTANAAGVPKDSFKGTMKNATPYQGERGEKEGEKQEGGGEGKKERRQEVGGVSDNASGGQIRFGTKRTDRPDQAEVDRTSRSSVKSGYFRKPDKFDRGRQRREDSGEGEREGGREGRGRGGNMSRDAAQSCGSTLISPGQEHSSSPSSLGALRTRPRGGGRGKMALPSPSSVSNTSNSSSSFSYSSSASPRPSHPPPPPPVPHPSPNPSRGKFSHKTRRRNLPMDSTPFPITPSSSSSSASSSRSSSLTNISSSSSMEYEMQCIGNDMSKGRRMHNRVVPHSPKYERLESGDKEDMARKTSQASSQEVPHSRLRDSKGHGPTGEDTPSQQILPDLQKSKEDKTFAEKFNSGSRFKSQVIKTNEMTPVEPYVTKGRKHFKETEKENTDYERKSNKREIKERKSSGSSISPYNTIPKKRKGDTWGSDNDGGADNTEVEGRDRRRRGRDATSFTSADSQHPISHQELSKGSRNLPTPEQTPGRTSRPTSRRALTELGNTRRNGPKNASPLGLPSPSPSCPPPIDEALQVASPPYQYHSLPQLNVASDDYVQLTRPSQRDTGALYKPYYMGDLYRAPIPGLSRTRRYSQTSLIDQALENLELSSLTGSESHLSNAEKRLSAFSFEDQEHEKFEKANSTRPTGTVRSPILPPLPAGVLDCKRSSPELNVKTENSPPDEKTNLASVCILSFDLTLDCEEFSTNGFEVVNIANKTNDNKEENEHETEGSVFELEQGEIVQEDIQEGDCAIEDTVSVCSSTLSIDEKYFDKDDYDNSEENTCDFISESQQSQLEKSIPLFSDQDNNHKITEHTKKSNPVGEEEEEEEDFIEIDCDVKPMETLKRPLVYGYGNGPVRSLKGKSFLEKRLSSASDHSEYLEMDIEAMCKEGTLEEVVKKSESCMNLRETYWDYWQAKRGMKGRVIHQSSCGNSRNSSPNRQNCPSERFCYDPEVLLAHVRCPKSLEDATFKQYSAYVKSHIYDYFGNVQEALSEYGLSNAQRNWIHSQPDLLPNAPSHQKNAENFEIDYSSEPELTHGSGREELYNMPPHLYSKRPPPPRPPPPPLQSRDSSQDSGTWTYLQSPQDPERGFPVGGVYPVPLPRSTSSLSHVGPITYNPWQHLLPNVTPPRTPRHSIYATNTSQGASRSASPSSRRSSLTSSTNEATRLATTSHQQKDSRVIPGMAINAAPKSSPGKKSFFPSLSKVVKSPLKRQNLSSKAPEKEDTADVLAELPGVHPSIQKRTHTTTSSKSSSSSSSSSSASSKDSVTTVIPASARSKGPNWLMRHFAGARSKMTAV